MEYEYYRQPGAGLGAEAFSAGLLSRATSLKSDMDASRDHGVVFLIAGVGTDELPEPPHGPFLRLRPGGGRAPAVTASAGTVEGAELFTAGYGIAWTHTLDWLVEEQPAAVLPGRRPFARPRERGSFPARDILVQPKVHVHGLFRRLLKSQSEWRAFVSWNLL